MARVLCQSLGHCQSVGNRSASPVSKSIERYPYQSLTRRFLRDLNEYSHHKFGVQYITVPIDGTLVTYYFRSASVRQSICLSA